MASARALCKWLLAVLITASEAEASKTRGVTSYDVDDVIPL